MPRSYWNLFKTVSGLIETSIHLRRYRTWHNLLLCWGLPKEKNLIVRLLVTIPDKEVVIIDVEKAVGYLLIF